MATMNELISTHDTCPICKEVFDEDVSLLSSNETHKLPFTCAKCSLFTLCGSCFNGIDWGTFECPVCNKKQGFDRDDPVPNRLLCSIITKSRQQDEVKNHNRVVSPTSVENGHVSAKVEGTPQQPAGGSVSNSVILKHESDIVRKPESAKAESSTLARSPQIGSDGAKKRPSGNETITTIADCKVGDRVYCLWSANKKWYWGYVTKVHAQKKGDPVYTVEFEDGDIRDNVRWNEMVTEEQYYEDDSAKQPKTKKAKPTDDKAEESQNTAATVDRKPAEVNSSLTAPSSILLASMTALPSKSDGMNPPHGNVVVVSSTDAAKLPRPVATASDATASEDISTTTDRDKFMAAPLFHLNSFVSASKGHNIAFGPFIREQVATPGFAPVSPTIVGMVNQGSSYEDVWNELRLQGNAGAGVGASEATQIALWLTQANVGSYVLMRQEYKDCPFLPQRLKNNEDKYIGPVYVLGCVTKVVEPNSAEERSIARSLGIPLDWNTHTFCRVNFDRMILKRNLKKSTTLYISKVCQKTLCKICPEGKAWPNLKTDSATVRADLWDNANIPIGSNDFLDVFSAAEYEAT